MVSPLNRRLLREWKHISRDRGSNLDSQYFHLKPQDSNFNIWHLVLYDSTRSLEVYMIVFIGGSNNSSDKEPSIIIKCMTPNCSFALNRNISLTHYSHILLSSGFLGIIQKIWQLLFVQPNVNITNNIGNIESNGLGCLSVDKKLMHCWNRVICKTFRMQFPELLGTLEEGDHKIAKEHLQKYHKSNDVFSNQMQLNKSLPDSFNPTLKEYNMSNDILACDNDMINSPYYKSSTQTSKKRQHLHYYDVTDTKPHEDETSTIDPLLHKKRAT